MLWWPVSLHLWHLQQAQHAEHNTRVLWPHGRLHGTVVPGTLGHAPLITADPALGRRYSWPGLRGHSSQYGPLCSCLGESSALWWETEGRNPELLPSASKPSGHTFRARRPLRHALSSETWLLRGGGAQGEGQVLVIQERASAGKYDPGLDTQGWRH